MPKILYINIFFCFHVLSYSQISDEELLRAIRHDEIVTISEYFSNKTANPDRLYGNDKTSLIHYAASLDKINTIEILLDAGATIEKLYFDETPLMVAAYYNKENAFNFLIKHGANVNFQNPEGKTSAIYAAQYNRWEILKILNKNGANFALKDCTDNSAIDYAYKFQHIESYKVLSEVTENHYEKKILPDYFDGPYVFWIKKSKVKVSYLINNNIENKCYQIDTLIDINKDNFELNRKNQKFRIPLIDHKKTVELKDEYSNVKKIMIIGDIHGGFDEFSLFLINNKIIDNNYNWIFGDGHVVLLGDIFDRGDKVTECLWLLYKLEQEAEMQNGRVHFILGNHEFLQFTGDKRFLSDKYLDLFNRLKINYTNFYDQKTELGKWLRTKNTVLKINDILFVHGGISPSIVEKELTINLINKKIREIISRDQAKTIDKTEELITGDEGPLWYRGYLRLDDQYYKATRGKFDFNEDKLKKILAFYNVNTIIFGHTTVDEIKPLYSSRLIATDIPFYINKARLQGVYYEGAIFYRAFLNGKKEMLNK